MDLSTKDIENGFSVIPENFVIKDSGSRHSFDSGSRRDAQMGKGFPDLISPFMLDRLAKHYEAGAKKYNERNWELGQPSSQYIRSCLRHIIKYMMGMREEDHLAAAIWNITGVIHNEELVRREIYPEDILDTPDYFSKETFNRTVEMKARRLNGKSE